MDELANKHWDGSGPGSRIRWVEGVARRYFLDGDWRRVVARAKGPSINDVTHQIPHFFDQFPHHYPFHAT